jgi:hypothetical protein
MKLFLLLTLSFIFCSYTEKNIDITKFEYSRYVKPQLKSISQDYKTLLIGLTPEIKDLSSNFKEQFEILKMEYELPNNCLVKTGKRCSPPLRKIKTLLVSFSENIRELKVSLIKSLSIDDKIKAKHISKRLSLQLIKTIDLIETTLLKIDFANQPSLYIAALKKEIVLTMDMFDSFVLSLSDKRFRLDLQNYHASFIKPVTKYILIQDNLDIFIQNINEFNIRLNALVMRITKFNFPVEKKVKTLSNIIHNRWNNILKVSLITK